MRRAAIDVGTHSVRLLVADVAGDSVKPVLRRLEVTRLGEGLGAGSGEAAGEGTRGACLGKTPRGGLDHSQVLLPQAIGRTVRAVREFWQLAHQHGAERVVVVGTSAVRSAANRASLVRDLQPIPLRVLSGEEEAELGYRGVRAGVAGLQDPVLVVDVGGGSTELALGVGQRVLRKVSLPAGSVRLTERYLHGDPPAEVELQAARREVAELLRPHRQAFSGARAAVGVGGTVTSLAAVDLALEPYDPDRVHGHRLPAARVEAISRGLCTMPLALRRRVPGLLPERADVICAGALVVRTVLEAFQLPELVVSESDLLWGALLFL